MNNERSNPRENINDVSTCDKLRNVRSAFAFVVFLGGCAHQAPSPVVQKPPQSFQKVQPKSDSGSLIQGSPSSDSEEAKIQCIQNRVKNLTKKIHQAKKRADQLDKSIILEKQKSASPDINESELSNSEK